MNIIIIIISFFCWKTAQSSKAYLVFPYAICHSITLTYFLQENPSKHPIIILKDVAYSHLQAILEFMYAGEVNVSQEQLPAFLKTADRLKVKGLAEAPQAIKRE